MVKIILLLAFWFILRVESQENAASYISKSLYECYNKTENLDRERRPPSDIKILIELLRKIESGKSLQNDREYSKEIIHRFKQDGITSYFTTVNEFAVPYSPIGFQSAKHVIYLTQLVPGNALNFPNETLNELERCSLHFMVSNSIDVRKRGDELSVCKKLNQYQIREKRSSDLKRDVETFMPSNSSPKKGNFVEEIETEPNNVEEDAETVSVQTSPRKGVRAPISECPIENGAVYTKWGTIQAGTVIGAIAAGRSPQNINTDEGYVSHSIFAATLAGDLAEVVLHQGSLGPDEMLTGIKGDWNSTMLPKWYFIEKGLLAQMTEAEIRAGLDGLIIAQNINRWKSKASGLTMSQIIDMYYSSRGVFSSHEFRACKRRDLFMEITNEKELIEETIAFSFLLRQKATLWGSILPESIPNYSQLAVKDLLSKVPLLQERNCAADDNKIVRAHANIFVVVDTNWEYNIIYPTLTYLLNRLDITKYDSNFTVINSKTGSIMVNNSHSILTLHEEYTTTIHYQSTPGFDVSNSFKTIEKMVKLKMDEDKPKNIAGGKGFTVLFMPHEQMSPEVQGTATFLKTQFRNNLPDVKLLVFGLNSKQTHTALVWDEVNDAFNLPYNTEARDLSEATNPVIERIQTVPRRLINPGCGSSWTSDNTKGSVDQYVDPSGINRYRLAAHYFFTDATRSLKVKNFGYGALVVCMSRKNDQLSEKGTNSGDVKCETITSATTSTFTLPQNCDGYELDSCPPVYISIEGTANGVEITNPKCSDNGCRFPDNLKYTIEVEGLSCTNNALSIVINASLFIITIFALIF